MNRKEALDILDQVHADDLEVAVEHDANLRTALEAVRADDEASRVLDGRAKFDRRVSELLDATAVPSGLRERLLNELGLDPAGETVAANEPVVSRRRWLRTAVAAASGAAAVGLGAWWLRPTPPPAPSLLSLRTRGVEVFDRIAELPAFDGDFEVRLPWSGWTGGPIRVNAEPKGLALAGRTEQLAAVLGFRLRTRQERVDGLLLITPNDRLEAPPALEFFDSGSANYTPPHASVAWTERSTTYVCVVRGGAHELEAIERVMNDVVPA